MAARRPKADAQGDMFDRVIDDVELEERIGVMLEQEEAAKEYRETRKAVYDLCNALSIEDGQRIRIGRFVVTGGSRQGGGFEIPAWTRTGIKSIAALD